MLWRRWWRIRALRFLRWRWWWSIVGLMILGLISVSSIIVRLLFALVGRFVSLTRRLVRVLRMLRPALLVLLNLSLIARRDRGQRWPCRWIDWVIQMSGMGNTWRSLAIWWQLGLLLLDLCLLKQSIYNLYLCWRGALTYVGGGGRYGGG